MSDRVDLGGDLEDVEVSNNGVGDGRNYDNWFATVEDVVDSDNKVTDVVDLIDGIFVYVLAYFFAFYYPNLICRPV